jgi:putative oxidoreductase
MKRRLAGVCAPASRATGVIGMPSNSFFRLTDVTLLVGRLLLALIFVHEGITLLAHFDSTVKAMAVVGISPPLVVAVIALQLGAGLSVSLGFLVRIGAGLLGLFCLATATLFHMNLSNQNELLHFEKDFAIAGGMFVLSVVGAGMFSLDRLLADRLPDPSLFRRALS